MRPLLSPTIRRRYCSALCDACRSSMRTIPSRSSSSTAAAAMSTTSTTRPVLRSITWRRYDSLTSSRSYTSSSTPAAATTATAPAAPTTIPNPPDDDDIDDILPAPTFSVRSLLPSPTSPPDPIITPQKLHHLLHLSALPPPTSPLEESRMLKDLNDQLHFVRAIQSVDTEGVKPLVGITRDQELLTERGREGLTLEDIERAEREEEGMGDMGGVEWDAVGLAEGRVGRFFVVPGEEGEDD